MTACGKNRRWRFVQQTILLRWAVVLAVLLALPSLSLAVALGESLSGVFLPSNRLDARGIQRAREMISQGEFSQAIRFLDTVLAREEDSFVVLPTGMSADSKSTQENSEESPRDSRKRERSQERKGYGGEAGGYGETGRKDGVGDAPSKPKRKQSKQKQPKPSDAAKSEHAGLKETARKIIRDLPPEGRRIYETTFGPVARRLLKQSLELGDIQQLRQITQRYFYTPAGHEAALLFAQHEADQGRHLTAALTYQQLLETAEAVERFQPQLSVLAATSWLAAGHRDRAARVLQSLSERGVRRVQLSGQDSLVQAAPNDMVDWLMQTVGVPVSQDITAVSQWLTARGNPARNGHAEGGLPHLRVRWQVRLLEHHKLEAIEQEMASMLARQEKSRLPAATPLAVGDYVITRSVHGLIAIDFKTGKRIWQAQPQQAALLHDLMDVSGRLNDNANGNRNGNNLESAQSFSRLIWEDYLYNTTSSDGKRVYVIRDLALPKLDRSRSVRFMGQMPVVRQDDDTNRLCAYDLPTQGKLVWEIDGAARSDELKGAFFLGAPVTVGQSLYCLAELKSETAIYLVALDRRTGDLRWRQQLADLETGIGRDIKRRLQASMPSYDGGMLVCPTGAGVVVGVDLAKQALAWAYRYQPVGRLTQRQRMLEGYTLKAKRQWVHSVPVIADGRILLTPPESNQLHCLDLLTGRLIWKQPRGDSLFLAGVEFLDGVGSFEGDREGRVLLVGNHKITALRLANGKPAWSSENMNLPDDGIPTGSGFFSKGQYFLPLSNAQVIAVDVATGKMVAHASSRDGQQLGNLICYRGAVISQTGRYLDCFEQVDVLREESERRLVTSPTDFEALRTLGEIAYNEGQLSRAVELLSKAYESEPDDIRTHEVLGEALVAALDEEFAEYQTYLPLLAQIQQGSAEERFTLMRLQSQGLLELGRAAEAFEVCLKAYDELALLETELSIGREHHVSGERWLAAQVAAAWTSASQDQREQITEQFGPLLEQTRQVADTSVWRSFYDCFGSLESTESLGIELATEYLAQGELLASQQLLLKLIESANPNVRRAAIANSSRLLHEAGKPFLAVTYDQQLRGTLAEAECLPGMTGLQCLAEWASAEESIQPSWPYGRVDLSVEKSKATGGAQRGSIPRSGIYLERSDAVLGNCNVTLLGVVSGHNRVLTVRDSFGRDFFQAKLDQGTQRMMNVPGSVYGVSRGNLLVVSLGRQIVAYDTLSSSGQALWRMNTTSNLLYLHQRGLNRHNTRLQGRLGRLRSNRPQNNGNWLGLIGPISRDSCVFQIEQRLVCVDVLSGEIKWSQDKLPLGCDLYGDEEYVFAVPKNTKHALVFSTVDGRRLGETAHNLPAWKEQLATVGRQVVRWRKRADRRWELSSIDSLQSEVLWKHDFEKNSLVDVAQNRYAAIVGPTGHCTILDIHDGEFLVDQPIEANLSSNEVHLMVGTKSFVLAVQQPGEAFGNRPVKGLNGTDYSKAFTGQVYAFDRQSGRAMWDRPAEVQGLPLVLTQPVDLPMIAFAGNIHRQARNRTKPEMGILLLEKSSGRMLFHDETLPQSSHYFFLRASDTELHEAVVEMSTRKIRLAFTDRPRSPEPPARRDVQKKAGAGTGGLQKIGGKIWSGG